MDLPFTPIPFHPSRRLHTISQSRDRTGSNSPAPTIGRPEGALYAMQKITIFQMGSLGDTVIAMPCYRAIARRHPGAKRYLLTNFPIDKRAVPSGDLLSPCGLIDATIEYPMPLRSPRVARELYRNLGSLGIDVLYYLSPEPHVGNLIRHYLFFKACGIPEIRGIPWSRDLRFPRAVIPGKLWESEASRLLRTIGANNEAAAPDPADRNLGLSNAEKQHAGTLAAEIGNSGGLIAISVGGKVPINDWGDENWMKVLSRLSSALPDLGAVFIGSSTEKERNDHIASAWKGPKLNGCGRLTPRETAALIESAALFLGHDTGTLHLAAAVGTRVIGVYSARNVPGKWFSDRPGDRFFYNQTACFGCELSTPEQCPNGVVCMSAHDPDAIVAAVIHELKTRGLEVNLRSEPAPRQSPRVPACQVN